MTNLLIGFNDIGGRANAITSNRTWDKLHPLTNLYSNNKNAYTKYAIPQSSCQIDYDMGEYLGVDITATASFIAFPSWFNLLQGFVLQGANNSSYTGATTIASISSADLQTFRGTDYPELVDYIKTFTASSAFRYFRITVTSTLGLMDGAYSMLYFGNLLDLEIDPNLVRISNNTKQSKMLSDAGYSFHVQTKPEVRTYDIEWTGVTNAKLVEFKKLFAIHQEPLIYLYSTNSQFLSGAKLLSGNIISFEVDENDDFNTIRISLKQAI